MLVIHTGELLSAYYNRKRIYKSALARKTGIDYQAILKHRKSNTIEVDTLLKISAVLEHNFLMDIAVQLPKTYTTDAPIDAAAANEIESLKEKIKLLEAEKQLLLQVIGAKG
ncbi:helix-turn-helix domain-containing protein [Flavobacterium granuli]|uniref:DNA-binding Xre family transcriptional regulator n=1 Tax=Flavobacterium granuli TaxID=280093 RepID=A0ABU1S7R1_9FLAO|nr:helix-turn-helix domain-containing protein [Flavobacterium granuli]MDR6846320.1 DNA-binding Xre family transcriptional regulator [Flavobacterium granuli]